MASRVDFRQLTAGSCDVQTIIRELIRPEHTFPGYRKVLLAWLRAWALAPEDTKLQGSAIRRRALDMYIEGMEALNATSLNKTPAEKDVWTKRALEKFKKKVLLPSGAKKTSLINELTVNSRLRSASNDLPLAISMVAAWHKIECENQKPDIEARAVGKLSLVRTFPLIPKITVLDFAGEPTRRQATSVRKAWEAHRRSIAFAYAASLMQCGDQSLLKNLRQRNLKLGEIDTVVPDWLRMALHVAKFVLKALPTPDANWLTDLDQLIEDQPVEPLAFDPPVFSDADIGTIFGAFPVRARSRKQT